MAYVLNLIIKDILEKYLLKSAEETELSDYTNNIINIKDINNINNNKITGLSNKIRRIATLIRYTSKNRQLFQKAIKRYKDKGLIRSNYQFIPLDNATR